MKALDGDPDAAYNLSEYYALRQQWVEADQWDKIGAENGHPISAEKIARDLWAIGGHHNCQRAIFWLEQAKRVLDATHNQTKSADLQQTVAAIRNDASDEQMGPIAGATRPFLDALAGSMDTAAQMNAIPDSTHLRWWWRHF